MWGGHTIRIKKMSHFIPVFTGPTLELMWFWPHRPLYPELKLATTSSDHNPVEMELELGLPEIRGYLLKDPVYYCNEYSY